MRFIIWVSILIWNANGRQVDKWKQCDEGWIINPETGKKFKF